MVLPSNIVADHSFVFLAAETTGGNGNGAECVFPFIFRTVSYDTCITVASFGPDAFCAVTSNYDEDGLYGYCTDVVPTVATTSTPAPGPTTTSISETTTAVLQPGIRCKRMQCSKVENNVSVGLRILLCRLWKEFVHCWNCSFCMSIYVDRLIKYM